MFRRRDIAHPLPAATPEPSTMRPRSFSFPLVVAASLPAFIVLQPLAYSRAAKAFAADATPDEATRLTLDLLSRDDADFRAIGLERVRYGIKGAAATGVFATLLPTLPAARQAELVSALADRGDHAALPAVLALLDSTADAGVKAACLAAVGAVGSAEEVPRLVRSLAADGAEQEAARRGLMRLQGPDVNARITAAQAAADPGVRARLIEILADRRARSALPTMLAAAVAESDVVRSSAMQALGRLGGPDQVAGMVQGLLAAAPGGERETAERAVVTVCTRNPGSEKSAAVFLERFKSLPDADREALVPTLGRVGGAGVLALVDGMIADPDAARRKLGLTALAKWPDATVTQRLLDRLDAARDDAERDLLLGALIRIAPLPDNKLDDRQKLDLLKKTMTLCRRDDDRRRVVERANAIRTIDSLRFVVPYLDDPVLAESACLSVVELAHHRNVRDAHKAEFTQALDKVIGTTKNAELVERAERYKNGQTWERKKNPAKG
jgi:HEAT repeat protein